ncbi:MAG: hypothetical protein LBS67_05795 [Clostridiales Family XIII bacterium]|jgi:UDP-N-acetylglucosamine transferase subunit ALG13|nr:hypothetical protein [Clostridiales Family XIII bacterium]
MILVLLGTQDRQFTRLLDAVAAWADAAAHTGAEIGVRNGEAEDIVVQSGYTDYSHPLMKIIPFIDRGDYATLISRADIIITHGGASSIISGVEAGKPVVAAARLAEYGEHQNDHQIQLVDEFEKRGHIIALREMDGLPALIERARGFKPQPYKSSRDAIARAVAEFIDAG